MQNKIWFLVSLLFLTQVSFSQRAKVNPGLWRELQQQPLSDRTVSLIVEGESGIIAEKIRSLGGTFKYAVGNLSSVSLSISHVPALRETKGITRVEGLYGRGQMMDEMTLINANVNPVHYGYPPLSQPYDGSGVIITFFDSGLDFKHPDFINADGSTRILYLWDQYALSGGVTPLPYNYGQEWDAAAIDNGQCAHFPGQDFGHGTNVTGIAAGNGRAVNNFFGVVPAADIIAVSVAFDENFLNNIVDATDYAFNKALQLGKPCVINASIGTYLGSHDGLDLPAQMINDLLDAQSGRSFVCAAGNAGILPLHLGYEPQNDSLFTWFVYHAGLQRVFFEWWIDKSEAAGFEFALGADNNNPYEYQGRTDYYNLVSDFNYVSGVAEIKDTLYHNSLRIGIITITAFELDSSYVCDISIIPDFTSFYWRFITNGTGRFDLWSGSLTTGTSDMVSTGLPSESTYPDIARYQLPDVEQSIVSSFSCSDHVITVANYVNRKQYFDFYGTLQILGETQGEIAITSSLGPTRDGRTKPDITAPGNSTLASGELVNLQGFILYQPFKVALGGMHNRNGGTSMASPVVAGVAALYLQKNPQATWNEVKDALLLSAFEDSFTGSTLPDNQWGYGKVDAFSALTTSVIYGCMDITASNFDPTATVDNGSCEYLTGIDQQGEYGFFMCYPNPASSFTTFLVQPGTGNSYRIIITDPGGRIMDAMSVSSQSGRLYYPVNLPAGIYFCHLEKESELVKAVKLIVTGQ